LSCCTSSTTGLPRPLVRSLPHPAFKVDNLDRAVVNRKLLLGPYEPITGYRVAIIDDGGMPVELIETTLTDEEIWGRATNGKHTSIYGEGADLQTILRFLLQNFVSEYELMHLKKLASGEPFPFKKSDTFEKELRRLLSLGLIVRRPNKGVRSLFSAGDDVRNHLEITDRGKWYLGQLADIEKAGAD
jgi:hypothetical protein